MVNIVWPLIFLCPLREGWKEKFLPQNIPGVKGQRVQCGGIINTIIAHMGRQPRNQNTNLALLSSVSPFVPNPQCQWSRSLHPRPRYLYLVPFPQQRNY